MARLNEPPASPETIDSCWFMNQGTFVAEADLPSTVKRKFFRQNRDIARANSTQSVRIRNLENEMSRLLSENLDLREQIIRLQSELESAQAQSKNNHTIRLKTQLESKLLEISALVSGLGGAIEGETARKCGKNSRRSSFVHSSEVIWKNRCSLNEATDGQDERLPSIPEHKSYPRCTLESQEILSLVAEAELDATESPEIGPPPVSQFVDEDPIKIDLPNQTLQAQPVDFMALDPALSITVEQRRKRKDSIGLGDSRRSNKSGSTPKSCENTESLRAGEKRKLSIRDEDEDTAIKYTRESSPDNFKFTRTVEKDLEKDQSRNPKSVEKCGSKTSKETPSTRGAGEKQTSSNRRVLAPKSVNGSPRKNPLPSVEYPGKPITGLGVVPTFLENPSKTIQILSPIEASSQKFESQSIPRTQLNPQTPAGVDKFSPSLSRRSESRAESEETPPPSDHGPRTDNSRPSRRARASVSYVEPNLRHKMRRPTKGLADAVSGEKSGRRSKVDADGSSVQVPARPSDELVDESLGHDSLPSNPSGNSPSRSRVSGTCPAPPRQPTHRKQREILRKEAEDTATPHSTTDAILEPHEARSDGSPPMNTLDAQDEDDDDDDGLFLGSASSHPDQVSEVSDPDTLATGDRMSRRRRTTLGQAGVSQRGAEPTKAVRKSTNTMGLLASGHTEASTGVSTRRSLMI